ncbi:uncharacterized protein LOC34619190 [Cyclospora cayetanensis]|uniref:ER membrane protein complex subunit 4 n=1 Tax=Cyclospora cayetanensis TaxID=88456 RepID=A0A6P6S139_9EIME|nr:uncharacterized protein LOC34619190 [Cyclospora cayetanensis]
MVETNLSSHLKDTAAAATPNLEAHPAEVAATPKDPNAVFSAAEYVATTEDAENFLERAEEVAERVKAILKGDLTPEQLQQEDLRTQQEERRRQLQRRAREIAAEERVIQQQEQQRRGKEGWGLPSSNFDWYCPRCRVEYKATKEHQEGQSCRQEQQQMHKDQQQQTHKDQQQQTHKDQQQQRLLRCYRCGGELQERKNRLEVLQRLLAEAQQEKQRVLWRRQKHHQLQRTKAIVRRHSTPASAKVAAIKPTDYEKWRYYEPESDEEEKQQQQQQLLQHTAPPDTPELHQLEEDIKRREKARGGQRHRAAALLAAGRVHAAAGRWLLAEEAFAAAVEVKPDSLPALNNRCLAELKREKWKEAEVTASKILEICELFENGYTKSRGLCYKALIRRAFVRRQLLKISAAAEDAEVARQLVPNPTEANALASELKVLLEAEAEKQKRQHKNMELIENEQQSKQQQPEQHRQQQETVDPQCASWQDHEGSASAVVAATSTSETAVASKASTLAENSQTTTEQSGTKAGNAEGTAGAAAAQPAGGSVQATALEKAFAAVFQELQQCGCMLRQLSPSTLSTLLHRIKTLPEARVLLCTLEPCATTGAGASAAAPLQLQMPRGPARCLLDFALQDIRLYAMGLKKRLQQHDQQQRPHQQRKDLNRGLEATSDATEEAKQLETCESTSNSTTCCKDALKLLWLLCSSNSPPALYESLMLPVTHNLLLLLQDPQFTCTTASLLAELSVHSKIRKEMARVAAADDTMAGLIIHWGAAATPVTTGGSVCSQGSRCALALHPQICCRANSVLYQQNEKQKQRLLVAARRCLCNFSLEAAMRGVLHQHLVQQDQQCNAVLLLALLPTAEEAELALRIADKSVAAMHAVSSKLDVLLNLTKHPKIRQEICSSKPATDQLTLLLRVLTSPLSSSFVSDSSRTKKGGEDSQQETVLADTELPASRLLLQLMTPGHYRLLLLNQFFGLLLNVTTDATAATSAAAASQASLAANSAASARALLKAFSLLEVASTTAVAVSATAALSLTAETSLECDADAATAAEQLLARSLSIAARILQQQPQTSAPAATAVDTPTAILQIESAAVLTLKDAVGRGCWNAAAAAAVRALSVSAQHQQLLQRAAAESKTTTVAAPFKQDSALFAQQVLLKDLVSLLQRLLELLISEGWRSVKPAPTVQDAVEQPVPGDVFSALGNAMVLSTSLLRMQLNSDQKQYDQQSSDMLLPLLQAAAQALDFEQQPQVQRNAAICIATAVQNSEIYKNLLWRPRCWDFTVSGPTLGSSDGVDSPPGFEFLADGIEKEIEYLSSLREQQQQAAADPALIKEQSGPPPTPETVALLQRKLWDSAIAPGKAFAMNLLMLYMGGGSGIFGVLILVYAFHSCIRTLLGVSAQFRPFSDIKELKYVWAYKCLYSLANAKDLWFLEIWRPSPKSHAFDGLKAGAIKLNRRFAVLHAKTAHSRRCTKPLSTLAYVLLNNFGPRAMPLLGGYKSSKSVLHYHANPRP